MTAEQKKGWRSALLTVLVLVARLLLALTFIFSGYVKVTDPLGTQYKIDDYLTALGLPGVVPDWATLAASVGLSGLELFLGILLLFAIQRRVVSKVVLALMAFMTCVTIWLVVANPIEDCGCFGDALKLTNAQSLMKNVVLLASALVIARWPLRQPRFISKSNQWIVVNFTLLFIIASATWSLYTLPPFDFRPYHVGASIREGMTIPEGAEQPEYETTFLLRKNGETREFTLDNYPDSTWEFVDSKTRLVKEGYVPPIHDFSIELGGEDITEEVLSRKGYTFLLIAPFLEKASDSNFGDIDQIYEYAQQERVPFYCLTSSGEEARAHWQDITGAEYPFCTTDATTLKTIIRSNPGLLLMKDGTVVRKWSHNRLPKADELTSPLSRAAIGQMPQDSVPARILAIVLWFVLPLFLLTLADRLWAWSKWIRQKEKKTKIHQLFNKDKDNEKEDCCRQLENEHEPAGRPGSGQGNQRQPQG